MRCNLCMLKLDLGWLGTFGTGPIGSSAVFGSVLAVAAMQNAPGAFLAYVSTVHAKSREKVDATCQEMNPHSAGKSCHMLELLLSCQM